MMEFLKPIQVAKKLNIDKSTVYAWHYNGKIDGGFKMNGSLRFDPEILDKWIKELQSEPIQ